MKRPPLRFRPNWRAIRVGSAIAAFLIFAVYTAPARAADLDLQWQLAANDCEGNPTPAITDIEIYVSTTPIPASNTNCPGSGESIDTPPSGGNVIEVLTPDPGDTGVRISVPGGVTYYIRARVRNVTGDWSNLSHPERVWNAPAPNPAAPTITVISL